MKVADSILTVVKIKPGQTSNQDMGGVSYGLIRGSKRHL